MTSPPAGRAARDPDAARDGKITRGVVLAAALELIDRGGVEGLTMRRLARAVNRDPMVLYRHAPNKAALLDGVAEMVLAQLKVDPGDPDWAGQLRAIARDYRRLALAHPRVVPLLVTRPLATPLALRPPGTLRPLEGVLALLTRPGSAGPAPCTSTVPCSASCTATSSTSCKNWSRTRTRPTTCFGWACAGCGSATSRCCAASLPPWPPTTAPPNSNAAWTSSWPGWLPH
jgi:AcrR family transcriptional regulator